jgi:hypothetical protein
MLISMPTGTSTIFGVFQVIPGPPNYVDFTARRDLCAELKGRTASKLTQVVASSLASML